MWRVIPRNRGEQGTGGEGHLAFWFRRTGRRERESLLISPFSVGFQFQVPPREGCNTTWARDLCYAAHALIHFAVSGDSARWTSPSVSARAALKSSALA